jgi:uncharacterized protein YuzE
MPTRFENKGKHELELRDIERNRSVIGFEIAEASGAKQHKKCIY